MTFDLEKYEEAIMSQDHTRRINVGLELADVVAALPIEELERFSQPIVDLLLEALRKTDWEFRNLISNALLKLGKMDFIARSTWFWKKLISTYTDVDAGLRSSAMDLLKELARSEYSLEILEPLIEGLQHSDKDMRILSANTLGRIRAKEAVGMLIHTLKDENVNVVYNVVECLGDIGDRRAVPALMQLLQEYTDEWVRVATMEALGKIGDQRVVELLLSLVNKEFVVDPLINALGILGDSRAIPVLMTYVKGEDRDIRELAVKALVGIWEEIEGVAAFTKVSYEAAATQKILAQAMTGYVKNLLLNDMNDNSLPQNVRENCAILLSGVAYQKALAPIVRLLEVYPLSKKLIAAVGRYHKRAFAHLLPLLEHADFRVRQSVGLYLQHLVQHLEHADSQIEHALLQLTNDENPVLNQIAVEALATMKSAKTLPFLQKLIQHAPEIYGNTVVELLARFPKRSVYNLILSNLNENEETTLPYYLKILGQTGIQPDYFKKFLKHANPQIQEAAILAVGLTSNPKGIPLLLPFIMSRQNSVTRCAATLGLSHLIAELGPELPKPKNIFDALFVMLNTYKSEEELATVARTLGVLCRNRYQEITDINVAVVRGRLLDLLPRVSQESKVSIFQALQGIVDMSSFTVIRELRKLNSAEIQRIIAELYSHFDKDIRVIADIADMISHSEFSVRKFWILTAGKLQAVELIDLLAPLLADSNFRREAFQALLMMGNKALPYLSNWLQHDDPRLKKMTALVLARLSQDHIDIFCTIPPAVKIKRQK